MGSVFRPFSLSRRIVLSVALGLALTLLLFGLVALWTIHESTEAAYRERVTLAQALGSRVDDVLRYALVTLEGEAASLQLEPGRPLTAGQRQRLGELRLRVGSFSIISITDADGVTVWTDPGQAGIAIGKPLGHPSVQIVIRTGKPQITEFPSPIDGGKIFACLAVPLRDASGRLAGALMAELDPSDPALNLLPTGEVGNGLYAQLLNTSGQLLAGTADYNPRFVAQHRVLLAELIDTQTAGYRIHEPPPGATVSSHVVAYAPVLLLPSWGVTVEQPRDVVLALPRRLQERLGLFGLAALLLAAGVAWLDVRRVVQPLKHLTAAAERFAAGQLDAPVRLDRADELGILASAFETMRQRLRTSLAEVAEWNRELERRVAARTAEVEGRNRELAHLNAIAAVVSGSLEVRPMLERTLDHVLEITGAEVGCFWIAEGESGRLTLAAEHGVPAALQAEHVSADRSLCGRAWRLDRAVVSDGAALDAEAVACRAARLQSAVAVPVPAGGRVQGVLFLGSRRPGQFQEAEFGTLAAIGRQVGIALANARLYQSLQARERERAELLQRVMDGQEEERRRLAQELHDDTSQALASLQLGLERLDSEIDVPERARRLAAQLRGVAAQTLAEVHRLAVELRPSVLDDVGLVAAIERYLRESAQHWGLPVDFAALGVDHFRLIPAAETTVYRIVQAALTNVAQHAQAQHVSVLLERRDEKLVVVVEDDGLGFELAAVRAAPLETRLGLAGMEERASLVGATLTIETSPGAGSTVFLEVPLESNCRREEAHAETAHRAG
ncbi:MAG: GAF domain-containing protein [Chloroflexi bacterium]|nr:GAF domain-containing protein [Chloroflexota bacterium]